MEFLQKSIKNTERIGEFVNITLPGFPSKTKTSPEVSRIHFLAMGEGEPLLLVHAPGQSLYTWRNIMPLLAQNYCVIAFDLLGAGFSGRPDSMNYSMDEVADSILAFCDALDVQKTHLLGFSLGAIYAMLAAAKQPERFAKIIALAPGGVTPQMPKKIRRMECSPFGALVRESYSVKHVSRALGSCYYDATLCDDTVVEQYFESLDDYKSRQALHYSYRNFDLPLAQERLKEQYREVLLMWGDADRWQPAENRETIKEWIPLGVPYIFRNGGHLMHEEKGEAVAEIIEKYLAYQGENV